MDGDVLMKLVVAFLEATSYAETRANLSGIAEQALFALTPLLPKIVLINQLDIISEPRLLTYHMIRTLLSTGRS